MKANEVCVPNVETRGWVQVTFDEAFEDATSSATKIPQSAFLRSGRFPVIDQGEHDIAGYSNDASAAWSKELPVIIFGDHTRAIKFVDSPFVLGADGCKVFIPRHGINVKFAYYYLQSLHLENAGYSRHFKFLRGNTFIYPDSPEQYRITRRLEQADRLRRTRRYALELNEGFLSAAFIEIFGDPIHNSKNFSRQPLEELIVPNRPITYGILKPGPHIPNGVPYVRVLDMYDDRVLPDDVRRTTKEIDAAYKRSRLKAGDLLLSIRGQVGRLGIVPASLEGANITQDTARLAPIDSINTRYLMGCLATVQMQSLMEVLTKGVAVQGINLGDVKELPIPIPPMSLQTKFADIVQRHEHLRSIQRESLRQADHLFQSLLHETFSPQLD